MSTVDNPGGQARARLLEAAALFALAVLIRLIHLDHTPMPDELFHVLAGRSLLTEGTLQLDPLGDEYTRGRLFTYLTAGMFYLFGEGLVVARILPLLFGSLLTVGLFLWVRSEAGRTAAWFSGLLLCFAPISLYLSQFARFYTLQALLFFGGALGVYLLALKPPAGFRRRAILLFAALVALYTAHELQRVTDIGVLGLASWLAVARGRDLVRWVASHRWRWWIIATGTVSLMLAAAILLRSGFIEQSWATFRSADLWARGTANNPAFYHYIFLDQYPTLWTLFPVAVLIGLARHLPAALFATVIFGAAFVLHSLAAFKSERYLFYAFPFFCAIWGMAFSAAYAWMRSVVRGWVGMISDQHLSPRLVRFTSAAMLGAALLFAALANRATVYTRHMLTRTDSEWTLPARYRGEPDWEAASRQLSAIADTTGIVISSAEVEPMYYLDRVDMHLRPERSGERLAGQFEILKKTGRPAISTPHSLERVIACYDSGLVVIGDPRWRVPSAVTDSTANYLEHNTHAVPIPDDLRIRAFRWGNGSTNAAPSECPPSAS